MFRFIHYIKTKKLTVLGESPVVFKSIGFTKTYWTVTRTLDIVLGDGPFNQLSGTKLMMSKGGHKSITAQFSVFSFYQIIRKLTKI